MKVNQNFGKNIAVNAVYKYIPYNKLCESKDNVRKETPPQSYIESLANSIEKTNGPLQNLIVTIVNKGPDKGKYAVTAGYCRWLAIGLLIQRKIFLEDFPVLCKIEKPEQALIASLTENELRLPMHPADRFDAYKKLIDSGESIDSVSEIFDVKPDTVERYLKLTDISPKIFALFRENQITLAQMQALTLADNHEIQEQIWFSSDMFERQPHVLKHRLTKKNIDAKSDPIARFVGLQAYEAAGGAVLRDLFDTDNSGYMTDKELLYSLASQKLEIRAREINEEGWLWVETALKLDYATLGKFGRLFRIRRDPTLDEASQLDALEEEKNTLALRMDALTDDDSEEYGVLYEQQETLQEKIDEIESTFLEYDADEMRCAGVMISIDYLGEFNILRGLIRPTDQVSDTKSENMGADEKSKEKPAHSEKLIRRLSAHRTVALQTEFISKPKIALAVIVYSSLVPVFYRFDGTLTCAETLKTQLLEEADDLQESPAWEALQSQHEVWKNKLPKDRKVLLAWIREQSQETQLELLAACFALNINGVQSEERANRVDFIADALELDMKKWWKPTQRSYFDHVSKARINEVLNEVLPEENIIGLGRMKKHDVAAVAEQRLSETNWLPAILRNKKGAV